MFVYVFDITFEFMYVVTIDFNDLFMLYVCVATSSFMNHPGFKGNSNAFDNYIFIIGLHSGFNVSEVTN